MEEQKLNINTEEEYLNYICNSSYNEIILNINQLNKIVSRL